MTRDQKIKELDRIMAATEGTSDSTRALIYSLATVVEALVAELDGRAS